MGAEDVNFGIAVEDSVDWGITLETGKEVKTQTDALFLVTSI